MKKTSIIIGYMAAFAITITCTFKFQHWPGAAAVMVLTALLLSIYFPVFILDKMSDSAGGKTLPSHIAAAFSVSLINLGVAFKVQHWTGASILLVLGFVVFSLLFIPLLYVQKSKQQGANHTMNAAGALGLTTFALGILFKIQHWPGAGHMLITAPLFLFLIYFPLYIKGFAGSKEQRNNYLRSAFFTLVMGCMIVLFAFRIIFVNAGTNSESQVIVSGGKETIKTGQ